MGKTSLISLAIGLLSLLALTLPSCHAKNTPDDYLSVQNAARVELGVPELVWNDTLAANAKEYLSSNILDRCVLRKDLSSKGINVQVGDFSLTGSGAVKIWVAHKNKRQDTAYAQVMWSASINVGCSMAECRNNEWMTAVVCIYDPPACNGRGHGVHPH